MLCQLPLHPHTISRVTCYNPRVPVREFLIVDKGSSTRACNGQSIYNYFCRLLMEIVYVQDGVDCLCNQATSRLDVEGARKDGRRVYV